VGREDLLTAIAQLRRLGGGYGLVALGGESYVRALPRELDADQNAVLAAAVPSARVTRRTLVSGTRGWSAARADEALGALLAEGVLWVDAQADGGEDEYWAPCVWERARSARGAAVAAT
jgi:ESCRT-II complex subunit VPS22